MREENALGLEMLQWDYSVDNEATRLQSSCTGATDRVDEIQTPKDLLPTLHAETALKIHSSQWVLRELQNKCKEIQFLRYT